MVLSPTPYVKSLWAFVFLVVLLAAAPVSGGAADQRQQQIIIHNARVITAADAKPVSPGYVIVEAGRIRTVGKGAPPALPDALRVDAGGHFMSPGLIDMHVHVFDPADLRLMLAHGITTARQMSGEPKLLHWRKAIEKGEMVGPSLVVSSPVINQRSQYASGSFHRFVKSPAHARKLVRKYRRMGYDLIKVYDGLDAGTYSAIAEESEAQGLPLAGHPSFQFGLAEFITPAVQSIEHTEMLYQAFLDYSYDPEPLETLVDQLAQHAVPVTPTLVVFDDLARLANDKEAALDQIPHHLINPHLWQHIEPMAQATMAVPDPQEWQRKSRYLGEITRLLHDSGVPLLLGSDGGYLTLNGAGAIQEMQLLVQAGIPSADVFAIATANGARALGREEGLGHISVGAIADLVLTEDDPRHNPATFYELQGVVKHGVYYDAKAIAQLKENAQHHMGRLQTLRWHLADRWQRLLDGWN